MNSIWSVLAGMGLGAGLMYILDPEQGRRRRDKFTNTVNRTGQAIGTKSRDLKDRAREMIAEKSAQYRNSDSEKESHLRQ
ncbi:MAG TPA: YtxH domain-containing protein [Blastocatellia bacterium]|nr:YtxH domain-containing protein [Blastocatellia bacterium]